jgi:hypothetical protein
VCRTLRSLNEELPKYLRCSGIGRAKLPLSRVCATDMRLGRSLALPKTTLKYS